MKAVLRIPTADMYAYIELEFDGTEEDILAQYRRMTDMVKSSSSIGDKEFNLILDELLEKRSINGDPGIIDQMSGDQRMLIQTIKRSLTRIKNKQK